MSVTGVSIHAPTWGATHHIQESQQVHYSFNPRTHMGCDIVTIVARPSTTVSIHAPTWGATTLRLLLFRLIHLFQSTHPHGVRHNNFAFPSFSFYVSIHAPTWGATPKRKRLISDNVFQSTHPHGVRPFAPSQFSALSDVSIHAPTWGATYCTGIRTPQEVLFQSTHPHGVRHIKDLRIAQSLQFQSTHPHGVRQI